ncbi:MAG: thioredoxin family protein [Lentisphaerota bacterium]
MKKAIGKWMLVVAAFLVAQGAVASSWKQDFGMALAEAKDSGKYILMNFSGSDWCGWCIKLDKEVFSREVFNTYADQNLVLVSVDFPRGTPQSNKQIWHNELLKRQFEVEGFPSILLLSPAGDLVARTGYQPGGAEAYIAHLQGFIEKHKNSKLQK